MAVQTQARDEILEHATRTKQLVHDPSSFLTELLVQQQQYASLGWLCHFDILSKITKSPSGVPYVDLARLAGVPETTLRAVARMAMTSDFLAETPEGYLSHNALSSAIIEDRHLSHWLYYIVKHTVPLMGCLIPAVEKWGDSKQSNHTAYNIMGDTDLPFFEFLKSRPDLSAEFDAYMESQAVMHSGTRIDHLLQGFDWAVLEEAVVVDVGGNAGATSITLTKAFPALRCIIQDLKAPIDTARSKLAELPADVSKRIEPQEHDFFTPQPVKGADVYLLRMILHDWKDPEAVKILKQLVDAAKPDSRILIMDMVLPTPGSASRTLEAALRQKDLAMLHTFNAKEREVEDWRSVLQKADPRLEIKAIRRPDGSQHSVIEAVLRQEAGTNGLNGRHDD
ncbi:hypothetical protein OEA41_003708 [Lepraria neglecta]|uniref:O-methyltransferase C-terminal domain-containing protein n=1 Tax=Lepraria neglecta TaxID=209136 RepID=A0AAE0DJ58_9LECA|nr:hypothetical protein OEA41_003708 [Lepraria neglecta]